ncbi:hypothetical protein GBF38_004830 [Nibea albiflora]|uniref:Uncharacterized protein n=1 Tax=Nibea albiflora TaxID=240163 RepID=A0ACB7EGJ3_NIBAL|nr:hypothetical protein GBF38_004830 [Nibea albiflora]
MVDESHYPPHGRMNLHCAHSSLRGFLHVGLCSAAGAAVVVLVFSLEAVVLLVFSLEAVVLLVFSLEAVVLLVFSLEAVVLLVFSLEAVVCLGS